MCSSEDICTERNRGLAQSESIVNTVTGACVSESYFNQRRTHDLLTTQLVSSRRVLKELSNEIEYHVMPENFTTQTNVVEDHLIS